MHFRISILELARLEAVLSVETDVSCRALESGSSRQQPGGETPGVAAAPVALAGAIVPGVDRFIVMLSAHADVFGVGITAMVGSILVPPGCMTSC
jgi:hypothetical protein